MRINRLASITDMYGLRLAWVVSMEGILSHGRVVLGPMSGYTTEAYRRFMEPFGIAASFTEMVSAKGLVHNPADSERFLKASSAPTGIQIFGGDPETLADGAAKALEMEPDARFIDINMGCPVRKVMSRGAGSAMMADPELCGKAVAAVKEAVDVPVTVKMRLGIDDSSKNFVEVVDRTVDAGVDAITVHSRVASQRYAGKADHETIRDLGDHIPVPLIVSGDIYSPEDASRAMEIAGAEGVMVARGGVGDPYLVTRIDHLLRTGEILPEPTMSQQVDWCLALMDMVAEESGEHIASSRMRSIAPKFLAGCRYSRDYRRALTDGSMTLERMRRLLEKARAEMGDEPMRPRMGWPASSDL